MYVKRHCCAPKVLCHMAMHAAHTPSATWAVCRLLLLVCVYCCFRSSFPSLLRSLAKAEYSTGPKVYEHLLTMTPMSDWWTSYRFFVPHQWLSPKTKSPIKMEVKADRTQCKHKHMIFLQSLILCISGNVWKYSGPTCCFPSLLLWYPLCLSLLYQCFPHLPGWINGLFWPSQS